jgi:CBS domain-containing protein
MTIQAGGAEQLIRIYNEIDIFLRQLGYQSDQVAEVAQSIPHQALIDKLSSKNRVVFQFQHEMRVVAQLRNSLVHNPFPHLNGSLFEPNPELIKRYAMIRDALIKPRTALSIAIPANKIFTATPKTNLVEVLRAMSKNTYTHVPIVKEDKMIGILSENTLLSYIADNGDGIITDDMVIDDLIKYLPLHSHASESFLFLPRNAQLSQVYDVFRKAINKRERIGMLFITENGKENEKPLGIITAWDLASPDFDFGH